MTEQEKALFDYIYLLDELLQKKRKTDYLRREWRKATHSAPLPDSLKITQVERFTQKAKTDKASGLTWRRGEGWV